MYKILYSINYKKDSNTKDTKVRKKELKKS